MDVIWAVVAGLVSGVLVFAGMAIGSCIIIINLGPGGGDVAVPVLAIGSFITSLYAGFLVGRYVLNKSQGPRSGGSGQ